MEMKYWLWVAIFVIAVGVVVAQQPTMMSLQGKATDTIGNPINGNLRVTISTSDSCEQNVIYDYTYNNIIQGGLFSILLGNDSQLNMTYNRDYYACTWVNGEIQKNAAAGNRTKFRGGQGQIEPSNITNGTLTGNWRLDGNVTVTGNVSATSFVGDGSRMVNNNTEWILVTNGTFADVTTVSVSLSGSNTYKLVGYVVPYSIGNSDGFFGLRVNGMSNGAYWCSGVSNNQVKLTSLTSGDLPAYLMKSRFEAIMDYEPNNRTVSFFHQAVAGPPNEDSCGFPTNGGGYQGVDVGSSITDISFGNFYSSPDPKLVNGTYAIYRWAFN